MVPIMSTLNQNFIRVFNALRCLIVGGMVMVDHTHNYWFDETHHDKDSRLKGILQILPSTPRGRAGRGWSIRANRVEVQPMGRSAVKTRQKWEIRKKGNDM